MKYLVVMFGLWVAGMVMVKYLEQGANVCPVTIQQIEVPRPAIPYTPTETTPEQFRGLSGTPVVYRF